MRFSLFILLTLSISILNAQRKVESSAEILHELQKLKVVGNVLYLAAHPDDENTRLIAWLENEKKVRTAYLSLTRGDGGQNLIGTEKGDALGVLRTQELLEARNEDGGEQFFSRAKDFGYSKTPEETFEKWNKKDVLGDVVWIIRKFQPDVIVTRFPADERAGHGHHTASAILAGEAFTLAADPKAYPKQLKLVDTWQAKRILWNTSVWWDQQLPEKAAKAEDYIKIDIGAFNPILGLSYSEIAADARSQHKSQGFGSARSRGAQLEYLKHTDGEMAKEDVFEGIDLSWNRIKGGKEIEAKIDNIIENFQADAPAKSTNDLVELYGMINKLEKSRSQQKKLSDLRKIILAASGIYVEVLAEDYIAANEDLKTNFIFVNRSAIPVRLKKIYYPGDSISTDSLIVENNPFEMSLTIDKKFFKGHSHPYWLAESYNEALLIDPIHAGSPENWKYTTQYVIDVNGSSIKFEEDLDYKWTDRAKGELHRDVLKSPVLTLSSIEESYLFTSGESKDVRLIAEAHQDSLNRKVTVNIPEGWRVTPSEFDLSFSEKGEQQNVILKVSPPKDHSSAELSFNIDGKEARAIQSIEHDHIKSQLMFPKSSIRLVRFELAEPKQKIAYIEGSGDLVDENLKQIGYEVSNFTADEILTSDLSGFNTILVGIRAYNTEESMKSVNEVLNTFAKNGGTVIVQYNTSRGLKTDQIGPYPLQLSRNRVTDENAKATILKPKHPLMIQPNKLTDIDFNNWVQERGLYFADEWDEKYTALIEWNDPTEEPQAGSLLVADYGDGHFVYTGISFFRQLPAGVPGAYRLLANIIAYGQE